VYSWTCRTRAIPWEDCAAPKSERGVQIRTVSFAGHDRPPAVVLREAKSPLAVSRIALIFAFSSSRIGRELFLRMAAEIVRRPTQSFTGESCIETPTSGANSLLFHC
jgi:hypothetical protein